jgi:hypothetical protein
MALTLLLKCGGGLRSGATLITLPMFGLSTLLFIALAGVQTGLRRSTAERRHRPRNRFQE